MTLCPSNDWVPGLSIYGLPSGSGAIAANRTVRDGAQQFTPSRPPLLDKPGYHLREIAKGVLGEPSKIAEEHAEFQDAVEQGAIVMALVELGDLVGAMKAWLAKRAPGITLDDLETQAEITKRAFVNGRR